MAKRFLQLTGVVVTMVVVASLLRARTSIIGRAQEATATGQAGPAPRTPWGTPDLQGIWTNTYDVPLQRPPSFANREFFTNEERAQLDKDRGAIVSEDVRRHERGTEQDVGGAYSTNIFLSHKPTGRRTSLIIDPPDGRIPALTPEAQKRRDAMREFQLALLQATETCKNNKPGCSGGKYGPPSPRRHEAPPFYLVTGGAGGGSINRSDGPEDRTLGERCMAAMLPDFGGAA